MENTTLNPIPTAPVGRTKAWILITLLVIAIAFWLWSIRFLDARMSEQKRQTQKATNSIVPQGAPTDDQLSSDLNAAMQSNTEIELHNIDNEFDQ